MQSVSGRPTKSFESREANIYLAHYRTEYPEIPDEFWTDPEVHGGLRRKRFFPDSINVKWARRNDEPWRMGWLTVMGTYLHANTSTVLSRILVGGTISDEINDAIPDWVTTLIEKFAPKEADVTP